jgi:hypothetical protein
MDPTDLIDPYAMADAGVLDANAVAGMLEEIFGWDVTAEESKCANCGNVGMGGTLLAFTGPGATLRCSVCHEVVIRIVRTPSATYIDARGAVYLRVPTVAPGAAAIAGNSAARADAPSVLR